MPTEITIVGGGLAGLTLGIALRKNEIPVTLWEAAHYPRHKVCGEFISGRGLGILERFGLAGILDKLETRQARTCRFSLGGLQGPVRPLPRPALCVSRYDLDLALAREFERLGGNLHEGQRWAGDFSNPGIVRATGRRITGTEHGWRWLGLKVHASATCGPADLEMFGMPHGYVGVCKLADDQVNVCGLFRNHPAEQTHQPIELLRGEPGTALCEALREATFHEPTFCAVAGLGFRPPASHAPETPEDCCRLGDAWSMTPPVTGNGMSIAFESAELALGPLLEFAHGRAAWTGVLREIDNLHQKRFRHRLLWARMLQWLMFAPVCHGPIGRVALNSGLLWQFLFAHTR